MDEEVRAPTNYRITWIWALSLTAIITFLHYGTHIDWMEPHSVYRRLYYLPVVMGAFAGGMTGGLALAAVATAAYVPHGFLLPHHLDPAPAIDKFLEIIMYFGMGGLVGALVERERDGRARQQALLVQRQAAEASNVHLEALVQLGRGLAHELRNPLAGIQGAIEIVAGEIAADSPRRRMIDVALRESERLAGALQHFLDYARPRAPEPRTFSVSEAAKHAVDLVGAQDHSHPRPWAVHVSPDLAAYADEEQVGQILVNLLRNARQATTAEDTVSIFGRRTGEGRIVVEVRDAGPGVPQAMLATLFQPYVTGREDGTGLGLAISRHLASINGGALWYEPNEPRGAAFFLELPAPEGTP